MNPAKLNDHIKREHEKVPCIHCGKLIGVWKMRVHVVSKHTSDEDKKYKCDVCPKGFNDICNFRDHKNVHTGEKPHKCKFCSRCFASRGTKETHQKTHLGIHRDYSKKKR